ncbi:hypothetical protein D1872_257130 [compost metagenome]
MLIRPVVQQNAEHASRNTGDRQYQPKAESRLFKTDLLREEIDQRILDFAPIQDDDRQYRSQLNNVRIHLHIRRGRPFEAQQVFKDDQMARGRDRQEFGNSLHDPQNNRFQD